MMLIKARVKCHNGHRTEMGGIHSVSGMSGRRDPGQLHSRNEMSWEERKLQKAGVNA